jgi:hypothetical protein
MRKREAIQATGRPPWLGTAAVALGLAVVAGLVYWGAQTYEVVEKGQLVDYSEGTIYRIEVFGVELLAEKEVTPSLDVANSLALWTIACLALASALILHSLVGREARRTQVFFGLIALGAAFLSLDELFGIHESLGHNVQWLEGVLGSSQPDGPIQVGYALLALVFVVVFRDLLLSSRAALVLFAAAGLSIATALAGDGRAFLSTKAEDSLELLAAALLVAGFAILALDLVARGLGDRAAAEG